MSNTKTINPLLLRLENVRQCLSSAVTPDIPAYEKLAIEHAIEELDCVLSELKEGGV